MVGVAALYVCLCVCVYMYMCTCTHMCAVCGVTVYVCLCTWHGVCILLYGCSCTVCVFMCMCVHVHVCVLLYQHVRAVSPNRSMVKSLEEVWEKELSSYRQRCSDLSCEVETLKCISAHNQK